MMTITSRIGVDEDVIENLLSYHPKYKVKGPIYESVTVDRPDIF